MKRIVLCLAGLFLLFLHPAVAQFAVYANLALNHHTDTNSNSSHLLYGAGVGLYDDFVHAGPVALGGDLRGDFLAGDQYRYRSLLLGARLSAKLPLTPVRPYIEPVIGIGGARYAGPTAIEITNVPYDSKLTYGFVGGIDWTALPHLDWRIEAGYTREKNGHLPNPNVLVSTGPVFRF